MSIVFGAVIVGDEILSGRRADKHLAFVSQHPTLRFSSLPSYGNNRYAQPHTEFSVSGGPAMG
ncbi:hypothetical protein ACUHMQ_08060 [Chitinimonas sp. PSY-7]|uniref:hypothetical protein n=1 Tax=Chitinimonas sp. PSY-7 TaxID=3459088 RepID=UPI00403FDA01